MPAVDDQTWVRSLLSEVRKRQPAELAIAWGDYVPARKRARDLGGDGRIDVTCQGQAIPFWVVLKHRPLHGVDVPRLHQLKDKLGPQRLLVMAEQVTQAQADQLRGLGIEFMDGAGNVFLRFPGLIWFMAGLRNKASARVPDRARLFRPVGLKVLYLFLCDLFRDKPSSTQGYLNRPYREAVRAAGVAFGSMSWIMDELNANAFIVPKDASHPRMLDRVGILFDRWVRSYGDVLRPKQVVNRYRASDPDWWRHVQLDPKCGLWGGEVAAAKMTRYLKPEVVTVYRVGDVNPLILEHRLRPDPNGPVEILDAFWHDPDLREGDCVMPLLAYADLLASENERNLEVAKALYERKLRSVIETA